MPHAAPLTIALEEYAYWRSVDLKDEHPARDFLVPVQMGAIGAAANICSRLAGHEFEGFDYPSLSLAELTRLLAEIRLAPRLARALETISGRMHHRHHGTGVPFADCCLQDCSEARDLLNQLRLL